MNIKKNNKCGTVKSSLCGRIVRNPVWGRPWLQDISSYALAKQPGLGQGPRNAREENRSRAIEKACKRSKLILYVYTHLGTPRQYYDWNCYSLWYLFEFDLSFCPRCKYCHPLCPREVPQKLGCYQTLTKAGRWSHSCQIWEFEKWLFVL